MVGWESVYIFSLAMLLTYAKVTQSRDTCRTLWALAALSVFYIGIAL